MTENEIIKKFKTKFPDLEIKQGAPRRLWLKVPYASFAEVLEFAHNKLSFNALVTITGLDDKENYSVIYHLSNEQGVLFNLETSVPKTTPTIKTVTGIFKYANWYERELEDLLGMKVEGLVHKGRYPLSEDWPANNYPLRKDWKGLSDNKTSAVEEKSK
jgi:Ni,Fe-hydrogenase III component G